MLGMGLGLVPPTPEAARRLQDILVRFLFPSFLFNTRMGVLTAEVSQGMYYAQEGGTQPHPNQQPQQPPHQHQHHPHPHHQQPSFHLQQQQQPAASGSGSSNPPQPLPQSGPPPPYSTANANYLSVSAPPFSPMYRRLTCVLYSPCLVGLDRRTLSPPTPTSDPSLSSLVLFLVSLSFSSPFPPHAPSAPCFSSLFSFSTLGIFFLIVEIPPQHPSLDRRRASVRAFVPRQGPGTESSPPGVMKSFLTSSANAWGFPPILSYDKAATRQQPEASPARRTLGLGDSERVRSDSRLCLFRSYHPASLPTPSKAWLPRHRKLHPTRRMGSLSKYDCPVLLIEVKLAPPLQITGPCGEQYTGRCGLRIES